MTDDICVTCSTPLKPNDKFCGKCGTPVANVVTTAAPAEAQATDLATPTLAAAPGTPLRLGPLNKRMLIYIGAGLAALAVLITIGVVIGGSLRASQDQASGIVSDSDSEQEGATGVTGDSGSVPVVAETASPAASAAPQPVIAFQSQSGNIRCQLSPATLVCQQGEIKYGKPPQACAGGPAGAVIGLTTTGVTWPCLTADVPHAAAQAYDVPISAYGITCSINYDLGIKCLNNAGRGFIMEYERGIQTF